MDCRVAAASDSYSVSVPVIQPPTPFLLLWSLNDSFPRTREGATGLQGHCCHHCLLLLFQCPMVQPPLFISSPLVAQQELPKEMGRVARLWDGQNRRRWHWQHPRDPDATSFGGSPKEKKWIRAASLHLAKGTWKNLECHCLQQCF